MDCHSENILSLSLFGHRKERSLQIALLRLVETWKTWLHKKDFRGAIKMELYKIFGIINHSLLLQKLRPMDLINPLFNLCPHT